MRKIYNILNQIIGNYHNLINKCPYFDDQLYVLVLWEILIMSLRLDFVYTGWHHNVEDLHLVRGKSYLSLLRCISLLNYKLLKMMTNETLHIFYVVYY